MTAVTASLERRALSLGTANAVDYLLQFALPVVLTRTLDVHAFGEYRLLWLAIATLTYALVEKPGMRLGHRLAMRWEARAAPAPAATATG